MADDDANDMVSSVPAVVQVSPTVFEVPFQVDKEVSLKMKLKNITDKLVAFKVKTTAPKMFSVKPSQDYIEPNQESSIEVTLQRQKELPDKKKDKFLIQAYHIDARVENLSAWWKEREQLHKSTQAEYQEEKIKCKYVVDVADRVASSVQRGAAEASRIEEELKARQNEASLSDSQILQSDLASSVADISAQALVTAAASSSSSAPVDYSLPADVQEKLKEYDNVIQKCAQLERHSKKVEKELATSEEKRKTLIEAHDLLKKEVSQLANRLQESQAAFEKESEVRKRVKPEENSAACTPAATAPSTEESTESKGIRIDTRVFVLLLILAFFLGYNFS